MYDHQFSLRQWTILLALATGLLGATRSTVAGEVDLPKHAISPDTTFLFWADVRAVTWEKFDQTLSSLIDAAPPGKKGRARELFGKGRKQARAGFATLKKGGEAGVEMFVKGGQASAPNAAAEHGEDAKDADDSDAEADEPQSEPSQLFVRMRPGASPKVAIAMMVATYTTEAEIAPDSEEAQALKEAKAMEFVDIGDGWFAAAGKDMLPLPPRDQARDTKPFINAMENHKDAAIRFAWLMNDAARFKLDQARLESGAIFFAGLITPLRDMQSASGGMWLGEHPKIVLDMQFADEADAQQFKTALDQLVGFIGLITALGSNAPDNPDAAREAQKTRAALTLLFLDREGANLSKTFDIGLLRRLAAAGLPWTDLLEPEEAEEAEEAPMNDGEEAAVQDGSS